MTKIAPGFKADVGHLDGKAMKHINVMPNGLPINSPAAMPMLFAKASSDLPADAAQ
jgi:hypothetical protein